MFAEQFANVRTKSPLIHNITNYVTVNDCANMVLACGASPIMADDAAEVEDITTICGGLNINIGTLNSRTIESMLKAGKKANALGHPVVLDPVGAGASALRTETAYRLLDEVRFTVIRGNISEVKTLASGAGTTKGVDADVADRVTEENLDGAVAFAKAFAAKTGAVVAITGAIDIVADGAKAYCIRNGHPMMSAITGTGCQLSALTAAFITANPSQPLEAAAAAVCAMGLAGEIAHARLTPLDGNATYRNYIIDAIYNMTPAQLEEGASMKCAEEYMRLYAVTDRAWVGGQTLYQQVESALKGGVTCVQLREKELDEEAFLKEAFELHDLCKKYNVPFFINDNVDIAIRCHAEGIHVGQEDMAAAQVRQRVGDEMMIGVSVHSVEEALEAVRHGADCLGVGAAFSTHTKADVDVLPEGMMKAICDAVDIPVVAIGGIHKENLLRLKGTGVNGVALVSAIFGAEDIEAECRELKALAEQL